jgi:hypothetical protein
MARVESEKVVERRKVAVASAPRSGYVRAMRLYSGKVPAIAAEVTRALLAGKDIESATPKEVEADIASVLTQYLADEKAVNERAKDLIERTGKSQADYSRLRALAAEERGIKLGDEALDYVLDQIVSILMHSDHVEEVFSADVDLRRKMAPIFKRHMEVDANIDAEVRAHIRNLREGTPAWEIEYERVLDQIKRRKGL